MKKIVIAYVIFFLATSVVAAAEKNQPQSQLSARYQIIPTEYTYLNLSGDSIRKAVLKIDTFTGKTWILIDDTFKGPGGQIIIIRGWEEVEKNIQTDDPRK